MLLKDLAIMDDKTPNAPILFRISTFILATKSFFLYFKFSHDTLINLLFSDLLFLIPYIISNE